MPYTKTNWQDGVTPLSAANMNKIEQGIYDAFAAVEGAVKKTGDTITGDLIVNGLVCGGGTSGNAFKVGNDVIFEDIDLANTFRIKGVQNPATAQIYIGTSNYVVWHSGNAGGIIRLLPVLFSGVHGDAVITSNQSIPTNVMMYNNLTIDNGVILSCLPGVNFIGVKGTLQLNGVISASGLGGAGGAGYTYATYDYGTGNGGAGGGIVIVAANTITGTGSIAADGMAGQDNRVGNASRNGVYYGNDGQNGMFLGMTLNCGKSGLVSGGTRDLIITRYMSIFQSFIFTGDIGGAGGGGGMHDGSVSSGYGASGGSGGAGCGGNGGNAGYPGGTSTASVGSGAGGGGGGGAIMVISNNAIPNITISARGGNGGNNTRSNEDIGGAGGGGGGIVLVVAPSSSAYINVSGGTGGSPCPPGAWGSNGNPGVAYAIVF